MTQRKPNVRLQRLQAAWAGLPPREQRLILLAAGVVVMALLWWLSLAPALKTLRTAPAARAELQTMAQQMQSLQQEAEALKALPKLERAQALQALEAATRDHLGSSAQLSVVGDRAQVTLNATSAQALADWLVQARANARAAPIDARLRRMEQLESDTSAAWNGTISLSLPP